jgi:hypothetical protein
MSAPLTRKPTRKAEALARAPPTIVSRRKEDVALKEVAKPRLCRRHMSEKKKAFYFFRESKVSRKWQGLLQVRC